MHAFTDNDVLLLVLDVLQAFGQFADLALDRRGVTVVRDEQDAVYVEAVRFSKRSLPSASRGERIEVERLKREERGRGREGGIREGTDETVFGLTVDISFEKQ